MAGAAGDALGYKVEFMGRKKILLRYGEQGITKFELYDGKALISDEEKKAIVSALSE